MSTDMTTTDLATTTMVNGTFANNATTSTEGMTTQWLTTWTSPSWINATEIPEIPGQPDVSTAEFAVIEIIWLLFCCVGPWTMNQCLRAICLAEGGLHVLVEVILRKQCVYTTSWFVAFLLTRIKIDTTKAGLERGILFMGWLILDAASLWSSTMFWVNLVAEGLIVIGMLSYMTSQVLQLRSKQAPLWVHKLFRLCLWGIGWGVFSITSLLGATTNLPLILWFMLYAYLFPMPVLTTTTERPTQRVRPIDSPWLARVEHVYEEVAEVHAGEEAAVQL